MDGYEGRGDSDSHGNAEGAGTEQGSVCMCLRALVSDQWDHLCFNKQQPRNSIKLRDGVCV